MISDSQTQFLPFKTSGCSSDTFANLIEYFGIVEGEQFFDQFGQAVHCWAKNAIKNSIRTLSLFSGAGGLDIAFHDAGFKIGTMVEIESRFVSTLKANCGHDKYFEEAEALCLDIHDYHPSQDEQVDFIIGGPPCQSFSAAGRRAAGVQGTSDDRGVLFEEYVRLIKCLKPRGFLFENVYGITGAEGGKAWQKIREAFENAGYNIFYRVLDAADYGVPQHRERMFIVGTIGDSFKFPSPTHGPDSPDNKPYVSASEAIAGMIVSKSDIKNELGGRFGHLLKEIPPGLNYSFFTEKMGHPKPIFAWRSKFSDFLYKADPFTPIRTLKAQGGQYTGPFHWDNRSFTIDELKRLQTIPDAYQIVGRRQVSIHQIGNSVPPQLARIIALSILNQLFDVKLPIDLPILKQSETLGFRKRKRSLTTIYRSKAKSAISSTSESTLVEQNRDQKYYATLSNDFNWCICEKENASVQVSFVDFKDSWEFHVKNCHLISDSSFIINVTPSKESNWALKVPLVRLCGDLLTRESFTGAWKAFESELIRLQIKADLVQLCGYYQYKPLLKCSMYIKGTNILPEWYTLKEIIEGVGIAVIKPYKELSDLWNISPNKILGFASWLRLLGYEVRNHRTNPQIPRDYLLVPYSFPTLNPKSVQLKKSLLGGYNEKKYERNPTS